jgi:hypothetical protein
VDRAGPPEALDSHSADKAREDDSLCQKSELAIGETQTSSYQKRLDSVLLRLIRKGIEVKQKRITTSKYTGKARELRLVNFFGPRRRPREASLCNALCHRNIHIQKHLTSRARKA